MPLSTYDELQTSILSWLARPGDPLVSPAVPDMIQLFEREATRRLKVGGAEKRVSLTALSATVALPADFGELRLATSGGVILTYVTPMQLPDGGGPPAYYTIIGNEMRLGPAPSSSCTIEIVYQFGVPPLSDTNPSNWLLTQHPDCYLFGVLVEAESFIGQDDRIPLWAQRREAAFSSIENADRKARWGGAPLSIRAEGVSGGNGTAAGDWTSAPPVPIPITGIVAGDGLIGGGTEGLVTVSLSTPVTIGRGGTGAATAVDALVNLGAAPLNSPALIGNPTAPTPAPGDADTSIATTAFVGAALSAQALAGDVTGPTNTTAVVRLQGRPIAATAPTSLQVLQWSGTNWAPATIAAGGTLTGVTAGTGITVSGAAPSPTVALTVPVAVANGGTGAITAGAALTALGAAPLASPAFTGTPSLPTGTTAVTQTAGTSNTTLATTAFVATSFAPLNAPVFTGDARAVTPATADNDTSIATTAYVQAQGYATSASVTTADNLRVLKAGDTITGTLEVDGNVGIGTAPPGAGAARLAIVANQTAYVHTIQNTHALAGDSVTAIAGGLAGSDTTTTLVGFWNAVFANSQGSITRNGATAVLYGTSSDERLKEAISDSQIGIEELMQIRVRDYNFKSGDRQEHGLVAQEVAEVYPLAVHVGGDDPATEPWMIDYGRLTPLLIKTVQQQQELIEGLSAKVAALEGGTPVAPRRRQ